MRRSVLIGLFCYSSRSGAWHTNAKWENSMCKAGWDANRKEELPSDKFKGEAMHRRYFEIGGKADV